FRSAGPRQDGAILANTRGRCAALSQRRHRSPHHQRPASSLARWLPQAATRRADGQVARPDLPQTTRLGPRRAAEGFHQTQSSQGQSRQHVVLRWAALGDRAKPPGRQNRHGLPADAPCRSQRSPALDRGRRTRASSRARRRRRKRPQEAAEKRKQTSSGRADPLLASRRAAQGHSGGQTMSNYVQYFGLRAAPFTKELDDDELWLPPSRQAVVDGLCEAIVDRDSVLLTGEPGVGKTSILRSLRHRLDHGSVRLTYCHNATLGRRDFYRQLSLALGLSSKATAAALFYAVSTHVQELAKERQHPVFLLDEAHLLHQDTLDHLHILLNYAWDSRSLLSLVLVGLPELDDRLALRRNRSLYSRLHRRFCIQPLTPA